jgi:tetratricopeptide (TPR) repeat protein
LYESQGRYGEAEPLFKRSLAIREKARGPDHPDVARSLSSLAELYRSQGRDDEAEPLLKRALEIRRKARGGEHQNETASLQVEDKSANPAGGPVTAARNPGPDYARIQRSLRRLDCYKGAVDGKWGAKSHAALARAYRQARAPSQAEMNALSGESARNILDFLEGPTVDRCSARKSTTTARRPPARKARVTRSKETRRRPRVSRARPERTRRRATRRNCRVIINPDAHFDRHAPSVIEVCD